MTNKKCTGCGAVLQHYNEALEGYVKEEVFENADIVARINSLAFVKHLRRHNHAAKKTINSKIIPV